MVFVGSYLMTGQAQSATPPNPSDGAAPVLDAIDAAGPDGADVEELIKRTGYDAHFLEIVLRDLGKNGMTSMTGQNRYHLTDFGAKARYIVAR